MEIPQELQVATAPLGYGLSPGPQLCELEPWLLRHAAEAEPRRHVAVTPWWDGEGRAFPRNRSGDGCSVLQQEPEN